VLKKALFDIKRAPFWYRLGAIKVPFLPVFYPSGYPFPGLPRWGKLKVIHRNGG
jgi:hypothetical protein